MHLNAGSPASRRQGGGIVEVSVAGGAFNTVIPSGGYPYTLDMQNCMNQVTVDAFCHDTGGMFEQITVALTPYIGSSVQIGFHVYWDWGA